MQSINKSILSILLTCCLSFVIASQAQASTINIIDDFEDGDISDWFFFGGNNAGGGGGILDDIPKEGNFYLSTGWGGDGSNSFFYGGAFKNFENNEQVILPDDPWFNVWLLNQSDASTDEYTLEITIREDLDGDGWDEFEEESFRLDTTYMSTAFDDEWTLLSAPVSSFMTLNTGGNDKFDGALDEIVIVISGVVGEANSSVLVDFDFFAFSSGGPIASMENPPMQVSAPVTFLLIGISLVGLFFTRSKA